MHLMLMMSLLIFSPAGWDNLKKISILYENMHLCKPDDYYTDIIAQPPSRKTVSNREIEVLTEDEQAFLARQQQLLQQGQPAGVGGVGGGQPARSVSPMRTPQPGIKSAPRTPLPPGQGSPNKKIEVKLNPGTPSGEGVLANFFNSLLHKKSGSPGTPGSGPNSLQSGPGSIQRPTNGTESLMTPDKMAMRTDAANELDRLARSVSKKELEFPEPDSMDC